MQGHYCITSKVKSYEGLPITYNPILLQNHIKERIQEDLVEYYSQYLDKVRGLSQVAKNIINNGEEFIDIREKIKLDLKNSEFDIRKILNKIERYEEERNHLSTKAEILQVISESIRITPEEEDILFEKEDSELISENYSKDFEEKFLNALKKLDKIKELSKAFEVVSENEDEIDENLMLSNNLSISLKEKAKYIEDNAYSKLVKFLKLKMTDFESPLESSSKFITFVKITLELLKQKSDYYNHVVKELVESRKRYVWKSFTDKKYQVVGSFASDRLSTLLSWLHQSLINEIDILKSTHLDEERIKICTNSIFSTTFSKSFK